MLRLTFLPWASSSAKAPRAEKESNMTKYKKQYTVEEKLAYHKRKVDELRAEIQERLKRIEYFEEQVANKATLSSDERSALIEKFIKALDKKAGA